MNNPFKLSPETDPRCIEYYKLAFSELNLKQQEELRLNWIKKNIKK